MDIKEIVKLQVVGQMGMGLSGGNTPKTGMQLVYQFFFMLLMSLLDDIVKAIPKVVETFKTYCANHLTSKMKEKIEDIRPKQLSDQGIPLTTRHNVNSLVMKRVFTKQSGEGSSSNNGEVASDEANGMVDAVLSQVSKLNNVPSFTLINNGKIMVAYKDKPIQLTKDIFLKVDHVTLTESGNVSAVKVSLLSNSCSAAEISAFVYKLYENYQQEIKNSLGNSIYYFDQKSKDGDLPPPPPPSGGNAETIAANILNHKRMLINTAPKSLTFTMDKFYSNKTFANICGKEAREIEKRVRFFIDNKNWYDSKGIPYQLGLLLSGIPGSGKTSLIRAIANLTGRHIVNVNFANINTATQLKNLFYSEKLNVYTDVSMASTQTYFIPIEQRLYVLEEIDAIGDIVKQRKDDEQASPTNALKDELTLMEILTVLDGTREIPGRIVIMTSNHPEVLDSALIRPGRVDVQVKFGYADRELIAEMYNCYLDKELPDELWNRLPDKMLSPAEVGQVLFRHFNTNHDHNEVIDDMNQTANVKHGNNSIDDNVAAMKRISSDCLPSDEGTNDNAADAIDAADTADAEQSDNDSVKTEVNPICERLCLDAKVGSLLEETFFKDKKTTDLNDFFAESTIFMSGAETSSGLDAYFSIDVAG